MGKTLIFVALLALASCQSANGSFCAVAKPLRPSAETIAVMTDSEVRDVLAHNRKGAALCGWKA